MDSIHRRGHATLLRLAWRNTWRYRRRTVLLIIVSAYATVATVFYWSFVDGYMASVIDAQARYLSASVRVATGAWFEDPDPENALPDLAGVLAATGLAQVEAATPRLEFPALLRSAYLAEGVVVRGVDPVREADVGAVPDKVRAGRWLQGAGEAVLGHGVAERLDIRLGERMVVDVQSLAGNRGMGLRVVGLVDAGVAAVDDGAVLIHLDDARSLTGVDTATTVALRVPRGREASVASALGPRLPPEVAARGVWDLIGPIKTDVIGARISAIPIGLLMSLFAAMAVTSTVLVSVLERTRELGIIEALGLRPGQMLEMVVLEAVVATTLGYLVGLVLGYVVVWVFASHNLIGPLFAAAGEAWSSAGLTEEFYAAVAPVYALYALATVLLAALFSVLVPARRILALNPTEAMQAA